MSYQPVQSWSDPPIAGQEYACGSAAIAAGQDVALLSVSIPSNASMAVINARAESAPGGTSAVFAAAAGMLVLDLSNNSTKQLYQVYAEGNFQSGGADGLLTSADYTLIPGDYIHEVYIDNYTGSTITIRARDVSSVVDTGVVHASVEFQTS